MPPREGPAVGPEPRWPLLAVSAEAIPVLFSQWRSTRQTGASYANPLILGYAAVYLAVMAVLWATALPAYFGGTGGVTAQGDPVGSLWYSLLCLVIAALSIAACRSVTSREPTTQEPLLAKT